MATGPLSLLGDAIAQGGRDYMNIKLRKDEQDQAREELLADRATQRSNQLIDVADARSYEDQHFKKRQWDTMVQQLIADAYLDPKDAGNQEAVSAALQKAGPEYRATANELAGYKTALPSLLAHVSVPGAEKIFDMKPSDPDAIVAARKYMADIAKAVSEKTKTESDRGDNARRNSSAYFNLLQTKIVNTESKIDGINKFLNELNTGTYEVKPNDLAEARAAAIQADPTLIKVQNLPKLQAAIHEQLYGTPLHPESGLLVRRAYQSQGQLKGLEADHSNLLRSEGNLDDLAKAHVFDEGSFTDLFSKKIEPAPATAPVLAPRDPAGYNPTGAGPGIRRTPLALSADTPSLVQTFGQKAQQVAQSFVDPVALGNTVSDVGTGLAKVGQGIGDFVVKLQPDGLSEQQRATEQEYNQLVQQPRTAASVARMAVLRRLRDSYSPSQFSTAPTPATLTP